MMTRTERLLRLARLRGDRAAELRLEAILKRERPGAPASNLSWTEAELRAAWGDR